MNAQSMQVLDMLRNGPITRFDAMQAGILNITARITNLRDKGFDIHCEWVVDASHHNGKTKFGKWHLVSEP